MSTVYVLREKILLYYRKYENLLRPVFKFLVALMLLILMRVYIGYNDTLSGGVFMIVIALCCAVLSQGIVTAILAVVMLGHLYTLSLETMLIAAVLLLLMVLMYFSFSPGNLVLLLLTPIAYVLKIHYVMPIAAGLLFAPGAVVPISFGVLICDLLNYIHENETTLISSEIGSETITNLKNIIGGTFMQMDLWMTVLVFIVAAFIVYTIRRLSIARSWTVAIITGSMIELLGILLGDMIFDTGVSLVTVFFGVAVSLGIELVIKLFAFNVDYTHVETVQFEDDDYYYYVKAVPKVQVALPSRTVKTIRTGENIESPETEEVDPVKELEKKVADAAREAEATEGLQVDTDHIENN